MASSEKRDSDPDGTNDAAATPDEDAKAAEVSAAPPKEARSSRRFPNSRMIGAMERDRVLEEARGIDFPISLRGYERAAVNRYVERVNRLIAELEMSSSPESAVRHALNEVSEETRDILQRAHQTADELTTRSRAKADDRLEQAEREAQEILSSAQQEAQGTREAAEREAQEAREAAQNEAQELREMTTGEAQSLREIAQREVAELRETTTRDTTEFRETAMREIRKLRAAAKREADEIQAGARREAAEMLERTEGRAWELARNAETVWRERRRLIDDMRAVGEQLVAIGEVEGKRFGSLADEFPLGDELRRQLTSTALAEPPAVPREAAK